MLAQVLEGPGWIRVCLAADVLAVVVALFVTFRWPDEPVRLSDGLVLLLFGPLAVGLMWARGLYRTRMQTSILDGVLPLMGAVSIATMTVVMADLYGHDNQLATGVYPHIWFLSLIAIGTGRMTLIGAQRAARARGLSGTPTLIVGAGFVGRKLAARLLGDLRYGLRPVGFLDDHPLFPGAGAVGVPVLGGLDDLETVTHATGARHVLVAFSSMNDRNVLPLVRRASAAGLQVSLVPRMFESINDRLSYESLGGTPLLRLHGTDPRGWQFEVKHALDRLLAVVLLAAVAPILVLLALGVRFTSPGPIVFRQARVGRDGRVFQLFKFRSMRVPIVSDAFLPPVGLAPGGVEGTDRRTALGRLMRRTSLDELPQLINVACGDMSLVGPRPERPEYAEQFRRDIERYGDRDRVKAGVTGWAQVHGLRGQTSIEDRAEWDNYYVEHWSLWLDIKILFMTLLVILRPAE